MTQQQERERDGLDVERLTRALMPRHLFNHDGWNCDAGVDEKAAEDFARIIAAEYDRLAPARTVPSPETTPAGVLDEAWAAAEKALPEGHAVLEVTRLVDTNDPSTRYVMDEWAATSGRIEHHDYIPKQQSEEDVLADQAWGSGDSPAAALHALAAALRAVA